MSEACAPFLVLTTDFVPLFELPMANPILFDSPDTIAANPQTRQLLRLVPVWLALIDSRSVLTE